MLLAVGVVRLLRRLLRREHPAGLLPWGERVPATAAIGAADPFTAAACATVYRHG